MRLWCKEEADFVKLRGDRLDITGSGPYGGCVAKTTVDALMKEFGFQIDDVRWHLCSEVAQRFLAFRDHPEELARLIWSGKVENELYDLEERYLRSLQEDLDRSLTDEAHVRQLFQEVRRSKLRRTRS